MLCYVCILERTRDEGMPLALVETRTRVWAEL
jgi:hypothetical protein